MNKEQHDYLTNTYPKIFSGKYGGIAVGEGWFNIINNACKLVQSHLDWKNKDSEVVPQLVAEQVKEKFGTLRFYFSGGDDYCHGIIAMAEQMSGSTCESCGDIGETRGNGWVHVYCNTCEAEREMTKALQDDAT